MIHRALQKIGGAGIQRAQAELTILIGGDDNHRHIRARWQQPQRADKIRPVHSRHFVVGDDQIGRVGSGPIEHAPRIGEYLDGGIVADRGCEPRVDHAVGIVVVHNHDRRHAKNFLCGAGARAGFTTGSRVQDSVWEKRPRLTEPSMIGRHMSYGRIRRTTRIVAGIWHSSRIRVQRKTANQPAPVGEPFYPMWPTMP